MLKVCFGGRVECAARFVLSTAGFLVRR